MIFKWYKFDFGGNKNGLIETVLQYLDEGELKEYLKHHRTRIRISYQPYDWSLNQYEAFPTWPPHACGQIKDCQRGQVMLQKSDFGSFVIGKDIVGGRMIAFDLICSNGHQFECWFKDSVSFESQQEQGIINCPVCDDHRVEKILSSFAIRKNGGEKTDQQTNTLEALRWVCDYVEKNFEDVGASRKCRGAQDARKRPTSPPFLRFFQIPVCTFTRTSPAGKLASGGKPVPSSFAAFPTKLNYGGEGRFPL